MNIKDNCHNFFENVILRSADNNCNGSQANPIIEKKLNYKCLRERRLSQSSILKGSTVC